jgi:O-antigen ligase
MPLAGWRPSKGKTGFMKKSLLNSQGYPIPILFTLILIAGLGLLVGLDLKIGIYGAGLIGAIAYAVLCIIQPFTAFSVLILLGLTVWVSSIQIVPGVSLMIGVGGIFLAVWMIRLLSRKTRFVIAKEFWYLAGLAVIIAISTLVNWGGPAGFIPVFSYVQLLLLTILVVNFIDTQSRLQQLGMIIIISSVLTAGLIILEKWSLLLGAGSLVKTGEAMVYYAGSFQIFDRVGGIFGDPNMTAYQLTIALPFIIEYWSFSSRILKVWLFFAGIGILIALSYTVSMGGLAGLASILLIKVLFVRKQNFFIKIAQIVFAGWIGVWLVLGFLPGYYLDRVLINMEQITRFLQTPSENLFLELGSMRGNAWLSTFKAFLQSPIVGNGPGNTNYISSLNSVLPYSNLQLAAHNFLLSIAGDFGIIGMFFFVSLLISVIWAVRPTSLNQSALGKSKSSGNAIFVVLLASVIQGMALDIQYQKGLWILLGMGMAYRILMLKQPLHYQK